MMIMRNITPDDYAPIIAVVNDWWGGRAMRDMLPKLFFQHFGNTSFVVQQDDVRVGFLVGLISQMQASHAYIHFVGVHPNFRKHGVGKMLYEKFFAEVQQRGCLSVGCVTSPINTTSIAFHTALGFVPTQSTTHNEQGTPYIEDYDGAGEPRVVFTKLLAAPHLTQTT